MPRMTTGTTTTGETMVAVSSIYCSADAEMTTNNRCSEAETRRNSNCGVIQLQTNRRKWQIMISIIMIKIISLLIYYFIILHHR